MAATVTLHVAADGKHNPLEGPRGSSQQRRDAIHQALQQFINGTSGLASASNTTCTVVDGSDTEIDEGSDTEIDESSEEGCRPAEANEQSRSASAADLEPITEPEPQIEILGSDLSSGRDQSRPAAPESCDLAGANDTGSIQGALDCAVPSCLASSTNVEKERRVASC